jgi:uncharacterized protein YbjT (DUF2867 family)
MRKRTKQVISAILAVTAVYVGAWAELAPLCRPIAAREVAAALVDVAHGAPVGLAADLAGPREEQMADMMRRLLRARGRRGRVLAVRMPGRAGASLAGGGLLPVSDGPRGLQTYEEWLESGAAGVRAQ